MANVINTSGKRKTAVARAVVKEGTGKVRINSIPVEAWVPELAKLKIMEPLTMVPEKAAKVDIDVEVSGGGVMGQADASRTAIAKAIVEYYGDETLEKALKQYDRSMLISDVRRKLPKKPLGRGARKKRQKSYR
ncbi:MAG: 30S ribosomal protein S9 [Methanomassiliicoccales archaeon PtaU1.Bin124]|nr:MAG: 30S ribosomal protein S9 [Methanomassiliicoccales archaeon PtaU1.Bin124]